MKKSFAVFIVLLTLTCMAEIRYVSKTGTSTAPYTSWATACDSIQKCINICSSGDTIYVGNGEYLERVVMTPGLTLIGSGIDSCIVKYACMPGTLKFNVIDLDVGCKVKNFKVINTGTIANGISYSNFTAHDSVKRANKTVLNMLLIEGNHIIGKEYGVRILNVDDSVVIRGNIIEGECGVDIDYMYGTIEKNTIIFNGKGINQRNPYPQKILNNIFYSNKSWSQAFYGYNGGRTLIANNLVVVPNATFEVLSFNTNVTALNNIVIGNEQLESMYVTNRDTLINNYLEGGKVGIWVEYVNNGDTCIRYNNVYKAKYNSFHVKLDSTNISKNPMFVKTGINITETDFHLQKYSPMIDRGDPNILDVDGTRSDIGIYGGPYGESYSYNDLAPMPPHGLTAGKDSLRIVLKWNKNEESDFKQYRLYRDTVPDFTPMQIKQIYSSADTQYIDIVTNTPKVYYYKLTGEDIEGNISMPGNEISIQVSGIEEKTTGVIGDYRLYPNYPNPFNPITIIPYQLRERGYVKLRVYDIKGEEVALLVNEEKESGYYEAEFNYHGRETKDISSGIYLYRIEVTGKNNIPVYTGMRKMILVK